MCRKPALMRRAYNRLHVSTCSQSKYRMRLAGSVNPSPLVSSLMGTLSSIGMGLPPGKPIACNNAMIRLRTSTYFAFRTPQSSSGPTPPFYTHFTTPDVTFRMPTSESRETFVGIALRRDSAVDDGSSTPLAPKPPSRRPCHPRGRHSGKTSYLPKSTSPCCGVDDHISILLTVVAHKVGVDPVGRLFGGGGHETIEIILVMVGSGKHREHSHAQELVDGAF